MSSSKPQNRLQRALIGVLALALPAADATILLAQATAPAVPQPPRGGLNPDSFYAKEPIQGVSVRDSLEAIKRLEDARRMARLGDWNKAADWYQEVIEKYGDRVIPSQVDKNNQIYQYQGIERPVQEELAKWPREGLDAYRNRYGAVARTLLDQARRDDRETLSKVTKLYFVTDAGKEAGIRLVDLLLENGEFPEAARVGDRLLDWHPNLQVERPKVLFRTALAYHLAGDTQKSKARADTMNGQFADATGTLFGKDVVLADALARLLQQTPPASVATESGIRYNPGGDESRSLVTVAAGRSGARVAYVEYADPPAQRNASQPQRMNEPQPFGGPRREPTAVSQNLGVMPVVDDEELYFQDGWRVYAVSLQSGVALPGWVQSYPNSGGQYTIQSYAPLPNAQHTLTLTDQNVLAVMGVPERLAMYGAQPSGERGTRLVCLNRADGKEKWTVRLRNLNVPRDVEPVKETDLSGSPLVVGDSVYVITRGGKQPTAEDCYVLCFDLTTGAYKWACFIASANNGMAFMGQPSVGETLSHLAYSSGRIFVLSNLGACAALDAYSGTISWLNIYPRDAVNMNPEMGWRQMRQPVPTGIQGWEYNPVIVRDGKVFVLPTDGRHVLVYDAGTGVEIKRLLLSEFADAVPSSPGSSRDQELPQALLAVDGKELIVASERTVFAMDWTANVESVRDAIQWAKTFPSRIRGRPFVTADSVFVCTELTAIERNTSYPGQLNRIARYNAQGRPDGKLAEQYPPNSRDWDTAEGEGPGNILVTGGHVVIAAAGRVNVYADMKLARKRLDDDVAAAPTDPGPYLRYAEVMFVARDIPLAMEKLGDAIRLLGGLGNLRPGAERDHLFNACITFAQKLQKDKKLEEPEERIANINKLYDLAAAAANGDSQQVNYRVSRAAFNREYQQPNSLTEAVRLYQEILTSPKLRIVPLVEDASGASQAGQVAEKNIAEVIKVKPEAYQQFEEQAVAALQAAGKDPAALRAVAESYPNSSAAAKAMIAAADAYELQNDHRLATHTLRQAYSKYAQNQGNDVKVRLLEAMARNYLAIPDRVDVTAARLAAVQRLGKGDDRLEKPLALPDKKVLVQAGVTFNEALKAVQTFTTQAMVSRLPDFHLPPPLSDEQRLAMHMAQIKWREEGADPAKKPVFNRSPFASGDTLVIEGVQAIVGPPRDLRRQHSRHDRLVAWASGSLQIYQVGSKQPVGQAPAFASQPKGIAWMDQGKSLLAWSDTQIALLGQDAQIKWKLELKALPKIEIVAGGASDQAVGGDNLIPGDEQIFMGGGQRVAVRRRVINGRLVQQMQVPAPFNQPVAGGAEQILHVSPLDDRILVGTSAGQLFAINATDGALAWHTRLSQDSPIERMVATDDFVVSMLTQGTSRILVAIDALSGQLARARMVFNVETGNFPVNFALAPDGMLVWVTPDRLCGKDLFEPSRELNYGDTSPDARQPNLNVPMNAAYATTYAGATRPDQLLISEGRILVVSHGGRFVSMHSLESGRLLDYKNPDGRNVEARLPTFEQTVAPSDWNVALNLVGPMLYVTTGNGGPMAYDLENPAKGWVGRIDPQTPQSFLHQDPLVDPTFLVLLGRPARPPGMVGPQPGVRNPNQPVPVPQPAAAALPQQATTTLRFHAYSRVKPKGSQRESGLLTHSFDIREDAGISEIEPVDGGFYYLTADKKLKFLKGSRP